MIILLISVWFICTGILECEGMARKNAMIHELSSRALELLQLKALKLSIHLKRMFLWTYPTLFILMKERALVMFRPLVPGIVWGFGDYSRIFANHYARIPLRKVEERVRERGTEVGWKRCFLESIFSFGYYTLSFRFISCNSLLHYLFSWANTPVHVGSSTLTDSLQCWISKRKQGIKVPFSIFETLFEISA